MLEYVTDNVTRAEGDIYQRGRGRARTLNFNLRVPKRKLQVERLKSRDVRLKRLSRPLDACGECSRRING